MAVPYVNEEEACSINYSLIWNDSLDTPPFASSTNSLAKGPKRMVRRANGRSQIKNPGLSRRGCLGKMKDGFTTMIDARWYWIILLFSTIYVLSWFVFAVLWFVVEKVKNAYDATCVERSKTFFAMFLFSIETQVTIGYGRRFVHSDCYVGIPLLMCQCLVGLFLDSFLLGLVFAKIVRPRQRRKSVLFSKNAVIHEMDGERVLELRIHNLRRSQLVEAHVRLYLYWYREDDSGECDLHCYELDVGYNSGRDRLLFITPVIITHYIDKSSPLFHLDNDSILDQDLEIVVVLEASVESTGLTLQALWSYTQNEILAGRRFAPMISRNTDTLEWIIDSWKINETIWEKNNK